MGDEEEILGRINDLWEWEEIFLHQWMTQTQPFSIERLLIKDSEKKCIKSKGGMADGCLMSMRL